MLKQEQPDCFEVKRSCPTFYARRLFSGASVKWWGTGSNLDFCSLSPRTRSLSDYISQDLTLSVARDCRCLFEVTAPLPYLFGDLLPMERTIFTVLTPASFPSLLR